MATWIDALAAGGKLGRRSIQLCRTVLCAALSEAVDQGLIPRSPAARLGLPRTMAKEVKPKDAAIGSWCASSACRAFGPSRTRHGNPDNAAQDARPIHVWGRPNTDRASSEEIGPPTGGGIIIALMSPEVFVTTAMTLRNTALTPHHPVRSVADCIVRPTRRLHWRQRYLLMVVAPDRSSSPVNCSYVKY